MELKNDIELENTRKKLANLESHFQARLNEVAEDEELHEVSMRSIKRFINQLKEEIGRYEAHQPAR